MSTEEEWACRAVFTGFRFNILSEKALVNYLHGISWVISISVKNIGLA